MGAVAGAVPGRRISRLRKELTAPAAQFESLLIAARTKSLLGSYGLRAGLAVGILFLMSTTPTLVRSIIAVALASIIGMIVALSAGGAAKVRQPSEVAEMTKRR
jgi:hypothetical protein